MEGFCDQEIVNGREISIPASRIVFGELLTEMLAAERAHGGVAVDNLVSSLDKYAAQLNVADKFVLVAVIAAKKMRVVSAERGEFDVLLRAFSGVPEKEYNASLIKLERDLGIVEWSDELKQYELITDAVTRGQYQKDLRKRVRDLSTDTVKDVFVSRAKGWSDTLLQDVSTSFGQENEISTQEWTFVSQLSSDKTVSTAIDLAFADWQEAVKPDQAKGQLIYVYIDQDIDTTEFQTRIRKIVSQHLKKNGCAKAPIWIVFVADISGRIQDYLKTLYVIEEGFDDVERDRYARFIPEDRESSLLGLRGAIRESLSNRVAVSAGVELVGGRLAHEANSIFKEVYSNVLPFPFDGFSSKSGNGAADAAALARALFGKEVSAAWLDVQKVQLQNRVKLLLGKSWGILDYQGKIGHVSSNPIVKDVLAELEKSHKKTPERTLADDLHLLLMPPYGCNLASAAILLGLLVAKTTPLRAIHYEGEGIGLTDWLRIAFDKNGKYLQSTTLEKTCLVFLKEDALTRWQTFLNEWEAETALELIVERLDTAQERRKSDPVPESLEANFKYLRDRASTAEIELGQYDTLIAELEDRLEAAARKSNVGEVFAIAEKLLRKNHELQQAPAKWTPDQHNQIKQLLDGIAGVLNETGASWIRSQACNSPMMVPDFRARMERNERSLTTLGLNQLAQVIAQHKQTSIASVEVRYQFSMAISEASDLYRLPDPNSSSRIREARDSIDQAEKLVTVLNDAAKMLGNAGDIVKLIENLRAKQKQLREFIAKRRMRVSDCFEVVPNGCQEAEDLQSTLSQLKQQFDETNDVHDIEARRLSVKKLVGIYHNLDRVDAGPDSIRDTLSTIVSDLSIGIGNDNSIEGDDGDEHQWTDKCIAEYIDRRYKSAKVRSKDFVTSTLADLANIVGDSNRLVRNESLTRYSDCPEWLSSDGRAEIDSKVADAMDIRSKQIQDHQDQEAKRWLDEIIVASSNLEQMPSNACLALLGKMDAPPSRVNQDRLVALKTALQQRADENDISDLVERISKLSKRMREALFHRLSVVFSKII
jgi:hypothetical protein